MTSLYNRVEEIMGPRLLDVGKLGLEVCKQVEELPPEVQDRFARETARVFHLGLKQGYENTYQVDRNGLIVDRKRLDRSLQEFKDSLGEYFELVYVQGCDEKNGRS